MELIIKLAQGYCFWAFIIYKVLLIVTIDTNDKIIENAKKTFETVQNRIYGEVSVLLKYAKLNAYDILKIKNPTYTEVAAYLQEYFEIIVLIAPRLKIPEHVTNDVRCMLEHFEILATGIETGNVELIGEAICKLDENCRL